MLSIRNVPYGPILIEELGEEVYRTYDPIDAELTLHRLIEERRQTGLTGVLHKYKVVVGFKGEGYSLREVEVEARTPVEARRKALQWYTSQVYADVAVGAD